MKNIPKEVPLKMLIGVPLEHYVAKSSHPHWRRLGVTLTPEELLTWLIRPKASFFGRLRVSNIKWTYLARPKYYE